MAPRVLPIDLSGRLSLTRRHELRQAADARVRNAAPRLPGITLFTLPMLPDRQIRKNRPGGNECVLITTSISRILLNPHHLANLSLSQAASRRPRSQHGVFQTLGLV